MNIGQNSNLKLTTGLVLGICTALTLTALADGDPTTDTVSRLLPYRGTLENNGQPVHAVGSDAISMRFSLFVGSDAELPVYSQDLLLEVYAGRFTTTLGPVGTNANGEEIPITEVIAAADDLYLGMTLLNDVEDEEDDIVLSNRQRIHASPYALWTTSATNLNVASDLFVGNDLIVNRDLTVGNAIHLPAGAIDGLDIEDNSLGAIELATNTLDESLEGGATLSVNEDWLDARIRSWVRSHCTVRLGWRNDCNGCTRTPSKNATVRANDTCVGGSGSDTFCRSQWGGVNTDGDVNGDDVFYIRFNCD